MKINSERIGALIMSALFVVVFAVVVVVSAGYPKAARLAPLSVSSVALVLALVQLGKEIYKLTKVEEGEDAAGKEPGKKKRAKGMPLWQVVGWLLFYFVAILTVGFWISTLVFTFVFLKVVGGRSWLGSGLPAGLFVGALYCLFELVLNVVMFPGFFFGASFG